MNEQDIKEMTTEKLQQDLKMTRVATATLGGMLLILFCVALYTSIVKDQMSALIAVPIALSTIVFLNMNSINKMKEEIKSRDN